MLWREIKAGGQGSLSGKGSQRLGRGLEGLDAGDKELAGRLAQDAYEKMEEMMELVSEAKARARSIQEEHSTGGA